MMTIAFAILLSIFLHVTSTTNSALNITFDISTHLAPNQSCLSHFASRITNCATNIQSVIDECDIIASDIAHYIDVKVNCKLLLLDNQLFLQPNNTIRIGKNHSHINNIIFGSPTLTSPQQQQSPSQLLLPRTTQTNNNYSFITATSFPGSIIMESLLITQEGRRSDDSCVDDYNIKIFNIYQSTLVIDNVRFEQISCLSIIYSLQSNISILNTQFFNNTSTNDLYVAMNLLQNTFMFLENVWFENNQLIGYQNEMILVGNDSQLYCFHCTILSNTFQSLIDTSSMIQCIGNNIMITFESSLIDNNVGNLIGIFDNNMTNMNTIGVSIYLTSILFTQNRNGSMVYRHGNNDSNMNILSIKIDNSRFESNNANKGSVVLTEGNLVLQVAVQTSIFKNNTGFNSWGAVFSISGANATINISNNCQFYDNVAQNGSGGVLAIGSLDDFESTVNIHPSSIIIDNCTFNNNHALFWGGALMITHGSIWINQCTFSDNTAYNGGSIYLGNRNSTIFDYLISLWVYNSTFTKNSVINDGCVYFASVPSENAIVFEDNTFINNYAYWGAAICMDIPHDKTDAYLVTWYLIGNQFYHNFAGSQGGAIYTAHDIPGDEVMYIINCSFVHNVAVRWGGAIRAYFTNLVINNTNFENNRARLKEGGVFDFGFGWYYDWKISLIANNCTFIANYAKSTGGVLYTSSILSLIDISDSIIADNYAYTGAFMRVDFDTFLDEEWTIREFYRDVEMPIMVSNTHFINNSNHILGTLYSLNILFDEISQTFFHTQL